MINELDRIYIEVLEVDNSGIVINPKLSSSESLKKQVEEILINDSIDHIYYHEKDDEGVNFRKAKINLEVIKSSDYYREFIKSSPPYNNGVNND